jgi:hypothetical protein
LASAIRARCAVVMKASTAAGQPREKFLYRNDVTNIMLAKCRIAIPAGNFLKENKIFS